MKLDWTQLNHLGITPQSHLQSPFCQVRYHIPRGQGVGYGHLFIKGHYWTYHTGPQSKVGSLTFLFCVHTSQNVLNCKI